MDDQRHAAALTDEAVGDELARDIARALAVDPSPEFVARVRTQIANEPQRGLFAATFGMWRRASALRLAVGSAIVAAIVVAGILVRPNRAARVTQAALAARPLRETLAVPYVGSGFSRTSDARGSTGSPRAGTAFARPQLVAGRAGNVDPAPLLDPRETQALRELIAGVRTNRVDLWPLLRPGAPAPMELPPVDDLVIAPLAIEPLAPVDGAQWPFSRERDNLNSNSPVSRRHLDFTGYADARTVQGERQ
jgi:hypothetical protein